MRSLSVTSLALAAAVALTGCATDVAGEPTSALKSPRTSPKPLPFSPTIKNRTNERTDGTTFEPCSAYTATELIALDIDPASISDAARIDGANYRGCHWQSIGYTSRVGFRYSQIVGNQGTLDEYKRKYRNLPWQPDRTIQGRRVAIVAEIDYCFTVFASELALVISRTSGMVPSPGRTVECDKAVAFASLAISKAPE